MYLKLFSLFVCSGRSFIATATHICGANLLIISKTHKFLPNEIEKKKRINKTFPHVKKNDYLCLTNC